MSPLVRSAHRRTITALVTIVGGAGVAGALFLMLSDEPAPTPAAPAASLAAPDAEEQLASDATGDAQARTVTTEDDRVHVIVSDPPAGTPAPYEVPPSAPSNVPTVVLTSRAEPYDLTSLARLGAAERLAPDTWMLTRSVLVARDAELRIDAPGTTLRLTSGTTGFASIVAFKGGLALSGAPGAPLTVTSWDPATGDVDTRLDDGRAYLRGVGARMDLAHVTATGLGFWSGRTGGVAWTGSASAPATGTALDTTVTASHYGLFVGRAADLEISGGAVRNNAVDGLLIHRGSTRVTVRDLVSTGNGRHGIAVSTGTEQVTLAGVTTTGNTGNGIRLDGAPLAEGATAGGASTAPGRDALVERATVTGNGGPGVLADGLAGLRLLDSTVTDNPDGIVVRGAAVAPRLVGNTVSAGGFGIAIRDGVTGAEVAGNTIGSSVIAVQVADAVAAVRGNTVDDATRYGISLVGVVNGSEVGDNRLAGRGPAAVDVHRVALGSNVALAEDDVAGWTVDRDNVAYLRSYVADHPLLLLWLLILVLPVAAQVRTRRRARTGIAHPYAHVPPGPPAAVAARAAADALPPAPNGSRRGATARTTGDGRTGSRYGRPATPPHHSTGPFEVVEATTQMPVTRVTIVSGEGAAPSTRTESA